MATTSSPTPHRHGHAGRTQSRHPANTARRRRSAGRRRRPGRRILTACRRCRRGACKREVGKAVPVHHAPGDQRKAAVDLAAGADDLVAGGLCPPRRVFAVPFARYRLEGFRGRLSLGPALLARVYAVSKLSTSFITSGTGLLQRHVREDAQRQRIALRRNRPSIVEPPPLRAGGCTSKYMPRSSDSLYAIARGFAFCTPEWESGIVPGSFGRLAVVPQQRGRLPLKLPPELAVGKRHCGNPREITDTKKPAAMRVQGVAGIYGISIWWL